MRTHTYYDGQRSTLNAIDDWALWLARSMPILMCKESDAQKQAQAQQNAFNQQLLDIYKQQFAEQQSILNVITPQLEGMAASPQGFGAAEYAALQAKIVNDVGAQYSNVAKAAAREFATTNEAGLPSGVELGVQGNIAVGAAGAVAGESNQLAIANEQMKEQQRQFALSALGGVQAGIGGQMQSTGGQVGSGLQGAFNNATTVYNQGSLWKNILGGVIGAGLNVGESFLTSGLSNITSGLPFFGAPSTSNAPGGH